MTRPFAVFVLTLFACSGNVNADDLTIKNVQVGTVLHGPPVAADQLDGSVVFVEEWGIH
jgi:hypothetical protein